MIKATSRSSYYQHVIEGKAKTQREQILECLENSKPLTRLQISDITGIRLTSVCGRVNALIENEQVSVDHDGVDPATNRPAEYLSAEVVQQKLL
jgi:predicted ArsR family transcriptional regulator